MINFIITSLSKPNAQIKLSLLMMHESFIKILHLHFTGIQLFNNN